MVVYAAFYEPKGMFDSFFNKAAAYITGGDFCHSDFVYKWNEDQLNCILNRTKGMSDIRERKKEYMTDGFIYVCFHVFWGDRVEYRVMMPDHINEYWRVPENKLMINMSWEDEEKTFHWCVSQMGKPYDYSSALTYMFRKNRLKNVPKKYNKYYCSMFMVKALQNVDVLAETINPCAVVPNKLYKLLVN